MHPLKRQTHRHEDTQSDRQTERQTDRQTKAVTGRYEDRQR